MLVWEAIGSRAGTTNDKCGTEQNGHATFTRSGTHANLRIGMESFGGASFVRFLIVTSYSIIA